MSGFLFHLVRGGRVVRSLRAADIHEARGRLGWRTDGGAFVVSDASWRIGSPRPLAPERCTACGVRDRSHAETPYCAPCGSAEHRAASSRHRVKVGPVLRTPSGPGSKRRERQDVERDTARRAKLSASMRLVWARRKGSA